MRPGIVLLLALVAALVAAPSARAEDPEFVGWTALLPDAPLAYEPSSEDDCAAGRLPCVDAVIREMERRYARLAAACDHDAIFALTYLRTTEEYRRAVVEPGFFEDPSFVNHEDVVFARYYFDAFDAWHGGDTAATPPAWRIAFRAAERQELPASGNMLLGVAAHVLRDLPFVLAGIGLTEPDGTSRKADHERVNEFLNRVEDDLVPEIAARFDPTADDAELPTTVDDFASFQAIPTWREIAWRHAELLVSAATPLQRQLVEAQIETFAATQIEILRRALAYPLWESSAKRDAYCAAQSA
jgi:hypothetical protein